MLSQYSHRTHPDCHPYPLPLNRARSLSRFTLSRPKHLKSPSRPRSSWPRQRRRSRPKRGPTLPHKRQRSRRRQRRRSRRRSQARAARRSAHRSLVANSSRLPTHRASSRCDSSFLPLLGLVFRAPLHAASYCLQLSPFVPASSGAPRQCQGSEGSRRARRRCQEGIERPLRRGAAA